MRRLFMKRWLLLLVALLALTFVPCLIRQARAQGPECPPGFFWRRMSGVGCMQEGCLDIANAKYSYTGACICLEGYKGCYEPVDYTAFDGSKCGPFCPNSTLVACVEPDAPCPGEEPAPGPGEEAVEPVGPPTEGEEPSAPKEEPAPSPGEEAVEPVAPPTGDEEPTSPLTVSDLMRDLEEFLAGKGVKGPTPGQAAAGAAAVSALLTIWVLTNLLSGASEAPPEEVKETPSTQQIIDVLTRAGVSPRDVVAEAGVLPRIGGIAPPREVSPVKEATPGIPERSADTPMEQSQAPPSADPQLVKKLEEQFQKMVDQRVQDGYYVMNRDAVRKAWNWTIGGLVNWARGYKGGQCDEFAELGRRWIQDAVGKTFGKGVIVDEVYVGEKSSGRPGVLIKDPIGWGDAWYSVNHVATRVILPTGESYILDFWEAIGQRQSDPVGDFAHDKVFGGPRPRREVKLIPEKKWIKKWKKAIGEPGDPAEVHNLHFAQNTLKRYLRICDSEEEAFQLFRKDKMRGVPDHQIETIINNWKKGGAWWGQE